MFNIQLKKFPKIYDFNGNFICELSEAIDVVETLRFGDMSTLTIKYLKWEVDQFNNIAKDDDGNPVPSPKSEYLKNDFRLVMNDGFIDRWYVLKIDEDSRTNKNELFINVTANEIQFTLQETNVEYLDMSPPIENSVVASAALAGVLESCQTVRNAHVSSGAGTSIVLDSNAHPVDDIYNGYKIKIKYGTGLGQERTIVDYNGTTKTATVDSSLTTSLDGTSWYVIYNDIWKVGTVHPDFDIETRAHHFEGVNTLQALGSIRDSYLDSDDNSGQLTYSSSFDTLTGKWDNRVNLIKPNSYSGIDIRYKKNMQSITRRIDTSELYTRMVPYGIDNLPIATILTENRTDYGTTYPTHIYGNTDIYNFQYFLGLGYDYKECMNNFVKDYPPFIDETYVDAQDLYDDAVKILNKASLPKITYQISALDLSKKTGREYEAFTIGDTVKIYDEDLGINIFATISQIERSQINPQNASLQLTNFIDRMSDVLKRLVNRSDSYTDKKSQYGNVATYIIADKLTTKNTRQADYIVQEYQSASDVIQKVIDSVNTNIGAEIVLLDGDYYFNNTVYKDDKITLRGTGASTTIYPTVSGLLAFNITGKSDCSIKDLRLGYNNGIYFENGVGIYSNSDKVTISGMYEEDIGNNFVIALESSNISVFKNYYSINNISPSGTADVISLKACSNCSVHDNMFTGDLYVARLINVTNQNGITTVDYNGKTKVVALDSSFGEFSIYNNYAKLQTTRTPFLVSSELISINVSDQCKVLVDNNTIISNSSAQASANSMVVVYSSKNVKITNNTLEGSATYGIKLNGSGYSSGVYVHGNIIKIGAKTGWSGYGIHVDTNDCDIQGNSVKLGSIYTTDNLMDYGAYIDTGATNTLFTNNELSSSGTIAPFLDNGTNTDLLAGNKLV